MARRHRSPPCRRKNEDPECEKAVVAWARGDAKEDSENSCRDVIARNQRCSAAEEMAAEEMAAARAAPLKK